MWNKNGYQSTSQKNTRENQDRSKEIRSHRRSIGGGVILPRWKWGGPREIQSKSNAYRIPELVW